MQTVTLSLIIPVYNEASIITSSISKVLQFLPGLSYLSDFELLIVDNASSDRTFDYATKLSRNDSRVRLMHLTKRGLGLALKEGIKYSTKDCVMFVSVDLAFGLNHFEDALKKYMEGYSLVVGSKGHRDSCYKAPILRKIISKVSNLLLRILFGVPCNDTQGTFLVDRNLVISYLHRLTSPGPFFQAQLVIYGHQAAAKLIEIPVTYISTARKTKMKLKDATKFICDIIREYIEFRKIK